VGSTTVALTGAESGSGAAPSGATASGSPASGSPAPGVVSAATPTTAAPIAPAPPPDPVVPTVTGQSLGTASANLQAAGYSDLPYIYDCYGSNSPGQVVAQEPGGGSRAAATTPIRLFLQADNCSFVPSVVGLDLSSAAATLQGAGFNDIPYVYDCYGSPNIGAVVNQSPTGGQVTVSTPVRLQLQANNC
jgi:serine/threonine-protein kinase